MDLKDISTRSLIKELAKREGIKKISAGLFQPYELKLKYSNRRATVRAKTILVFNYREF